MASPSIKSLNRKTLSTVHENFRHRIEDLFEIRNGDNPNLLGGYNETTQLIQQFLQKAQQSRQSVRVMGGNWSWTTVAFTKGWIVNSLRLNRIKITLPEEIEPSFGPFEENKLLFTQCGCTVIELNNALRSLGRSIKTSGASNGQTIAGLISNNSHGSAIDFGSTQDFVVGLHLIVGPQKHVYLERASKPVVTDVFIKKIGAELIRDDELFNAALVSFGSFGFIHGVMIETEPLFLFNIFRKQIPSNKVRPLMESLDFTHANFLARPNQRPFHFQVTINPFDTSKGPYVTVMYKDPYHDDYPRIVTETDKAGPGEDAPVVLGKLTAILPSITPLIVSTTLKNAYKNINNAFGTHGEVFSATLARGKVLSAAIGVPLEKTNAVIDIALEVNKQHPFAGIFACRFVKQTKATLGFTKFPVTCIAEFDSFEAPNTHKFYAALWKALDDAAIPYSFHWGKINNLNAAKVRKIYGGNVEKWIIARNKLLPKEMRPVFTNEFMVQTGLDKDLGN